MIYKFRNSIEDVPCCFARSSVKFQGHTWRKTKDFAPITQCPVGNSNSNKRRATKWHTASRGKEGVPNCFSRLPAKFPCPTGQNIDDLGPIWARLLGWSQLSNPLDLPCLFWYDRKIFMMWPCIWCTSIMLSLQLQTTYLRVISSNV